MGFNIAKPYHDDGADKVALDSWDIPGLITSVHVDGTLNDPRDKDRSWSIEIAIPWKSLIGTLDQITHLKMEISGKSTLAEFIGRQR